MFEQLAEWYLQRRGRTVLPRIFIGIVFGGCVAQRVESDGRYDHWTVIVPSCGQLVTMTSSQVIYGQAE